MEYGIEATATRECKRGIDIISRAFLVAHLLTASIDQAERATMEAISSSNPDDESEVALLAGVLEAAARTKIKQATRDSNKPDEAGAHLPSELQAVLRLAPELRRCFVLRILVGLSRQVCTRLLDLDSHDVDEYTCAALKCLPSLLSDQPTS